MSKRNKWSDETKDVAGLLTPGTEVTEPSAPEPKAKQEPPKPDAKVCTPHQWAVKQGRFTRANPLVPQTRDHYDVAHACADVLHGWARHDYNFQTDPVKLTEDDYNAALDAAMHYPNKQPHKAALKG